MKQYNFLLVDDEPDAINGLQYLLKAVFIQSFNHYAANTVKDALKIWKEKDIDLIFLDIQLGSQNGFQLLAEIPEHLRPPVIFVTAFDQFAMKALNSAALYYITKPVIKKELAKAMERFIGVNEIKIQQEQFQILVENILQPTNEINRLALPVGDKLEIVAKNKIIRCESESNYTHIFTIDNHRYTVAKTLKEVEKLLPATFIRVHRSYLVNINMLKSIDRKNSTLDLIDGTKFPISEDRKSILLDALK
jgi:two-component system LytT family response regulator